MKRLIDWMARKLTPWVEPWLFPSPWAFPRLARAASLVLLVFAPIMASLPMTADELTRALGRIERRQEHLGQRLEDVAERLSVIEKGVAGHVSVQGHPDMVARVKQIEDRGWQVVMLFLVNLLAVIVAGVVNHSKLRRLQNGGG